MTIRITTAPSCDQRAEDALAYRRTVAHGVRVGLAADATQLAIGDRLCIDVAAGRATDWALLCDHLTNLADETARKDRLMATATVDDNEPKHECPGGCGATVPDKWFACTNCFSLLPFDLRDEIRAARGERRAAVSVRAVEWLRQNIEGGQQKNPPKSSGWQIADRFGGYPW